MNLRHGPGNVIPTLLSMLPVLEVHISDAVKYNSKISLVMQRDLMISLSDLVLLEANKSMDHTSVILSVYRCHWSVWCVLFSYQGCLVDADDDRPALAVTFMYEGKSSLSDISEFSQFREAGQQRSSGL